MARGRKSRAEEWLTDDGLLLLEGYAREGLTDKDIAEKRVGVSETTFTRWKDKYPPILTALKKGRAPVAEKIEKSLYDICQKQSYTETIVEETRDANGIMVSQHIRKITREVPPNVTAIIFALRNLKRGKWSNNPEAAYTPPEIADEGFIKALNGSAAADWSEQ